MELAIIHPGGDAREVTVALSACQSFYLALPTLSSEA